MSEMTAYAASKIVNGWIAEKGVDKKLPAQMIYTYVKKGYITSVEKDGKRLVTIESLSEWFGRYANKHFPTGQVETVDENQLELFNEETVETDQS